MPSKRKTSKHVEAVLDEMLEESFPASDPPQLEGGVTAQPAHAAPHHPGEHAPPPQVPPRPQADAMLDRREGRYVLGDSGEASLETNAGTVTLRLPANPLRLDAAALETLIDALQKHRPPLQR